MNNGISKKFEDLEQKSELLCSSDDESESFYSDSDRDDIKNKDDYIAALQNVA